MVIVLSQVQQWLETTKLRLDSIDPALEKTARDQVFSMLSAVFTINTWVDNSTTPTLVSQAIAMLVAAWTYNRAYSEETTAGNPYALWLEQKALALVDGIRDGSIDLIEVPGVGVEQAILSFLPNDATGTNEVYDGVGNLIGLQGSEDRKFFMGTRW